MLLELPSAAGEPRWFSNKRYIGNCGEPCIFFVLRCLASVCFSWSVFFFLVYPSNGTHTDLPSLYRREMPGENLIYRLGFPRIRMPSVGRSSVLSCWSLLFSPRMQRLCNTRECLSAAH